MDDFIDDGEGEGAGRRRRRRAAGSGGGGFASQAMAEAARIFGDATDLHDLVASRRALAASQGGADAGGDEGVDEEEEEGLEEGDEEDEEAAADARERRAALARERQQQRLLDAADPEYAAAHYLSAEDEAIRAADRPERLQLALRKNMAALAAMSEADFSSLMENMAKCGPHCI
ncbi:hypothetical protein MNEG_15634 [Monoraphidium neglectum]|uniref:Uncharacterized protein n=1 Tax=Monoraphidium neglectum TaxID=145388 RepID=A0A0D2LK29_9CHLO|nr:hypothetical protein MNEG_15634 [Monoraphidium neglectum]KIY92329.1 hypothetical protein MNEG_15634 [Monoraphidium neglectum]|eukprot:XP_013891349.1 hypothetical protein MNEG_15634 [Monoraphidium neglectum]